MFDPTKDFKKIKDLAIVNFYIKSCQTLAVLTVKKQVFKALAG